MRLSKEQLQLGCAFILDVMDALEAALAAQPASPVAMNAPLEGMTFEKWWETQVETTQRDYQVADKVWHIAWQACSRTHAKTPKHPSGMTLDISDEPFHIERAAPTAMTKAQMEASLIGERKDCEKALLALAGKYPTPVEGYGTNTSWAISDLCRFIGELADREKAIEAAALEKAASIVKKWDFMACSDADGLEFEIRELITPDRQSALDEALRKRALEAVTPPKQLLDEYDEAVEQASSVGAFKVLTNARAKLGDWLIKQLAALRTPAAGDKEAGK